MIINPLLIRQEYASILLKLRVLSKLPIEKQADILQSLGRALSDSIAENCCPSDMIHNIYSQSMSDRMDDVDKLLSLLQYEENKEELTHVKVQEEEFELRIPKNRTMEVQKKTG